MTAQTDTPAAPAAPTEGERADLLAELGQARHFLRFTVRDLDDAQARLRTTASELCLGGLLKHVTAVERAWTRFIVEGASSMQFEGEAAAEAHRRGFDMTEDDTLAGLLDAYQEVAESTDHLVATLPDLDHLHPLAPAPWLPPGTVWSTRRVLLHVVAETAHHAGHADIIRASIDGAKSMG